MFDIGMKTVVLNLTDGDIEQLDLLTRLLRQMASYGGPTLDGELVQLSTIILLERAVASVRSQEAACHQ